MHSYENRYYLIDAIRGIAIISMVLFHFCYDVFIIYGKNINWYSFSLTTLWQQSICWTYILIAGLVWRFGKETSAKRGLLLLLCSLLISLVTLIAMPSSAVWFGILSFLGCAILIMIPFHSIIEKIPPIIGIFVSFLCFFLFRNVGNGYLGTSDFSLITLPDWLYNVKFLTPLGFPFPGFSSSDYFPIFPWFFLFLAGYFIAPIITLNKNLSNLFKYKIPFLSTIGQKSLWIYLLHQPIGLLICEILF